MIGDVRDSVTVARAVEHVDAVVHLAAIVGDPACARNPEAARAINEHGSLQLIRAAQTAGVSRFIFVSTCSNYGRMNDTSVAATEEHELRPLSLYAETKVAVERALLGHGASTMAGTVLRLATLFGVSPRMRFDLTVNQFVMEMLVHRRLVVYRRALLAALRASSRCGTRDHDRAERARGSGAEPGVQRGAHGRELSQDRSGRDD